MKIIVTVEGGAVSSIICSEAAEFMLIDYDNIKEGDAFPESFHTAEKISESEIMPHIEKLKGEC